MTESAGDASALQVPPIREALVTTVLGVTLIVLTFVMLIVIPGDVDVVTALQFAGSDDRLTDRLADQEVMVSLTEARSGVLRAGIWTIVWGVVGFFIFAGLPGRRGSTEVPEGKLPRKFGRGYWDHAWKAKPGTDLYGYRIGYALVGGVVVGLCEKILTYTLVEQAGAVVGLRGDAVPAIVVTLAWTKWIIAGSAAALIVLMAISLLTAFMRKEVEMSDDQPVEPEPPTSPVVGVCCSGGGIRSAGFSLGGLSALERADGGQSGTRLGVLGKADYLASVSGGGYAAASWRIAAGTTTLPDEPIIGRPDDVARVIRQYPEGPAVDLVQHVLERRRFLANGPGGLPRSAMVAIARTLWHLGLLIATVFVVSWPLGRIIVTWPITGVGRRDNTLDDGLNFDLDAHQWMPSLVFLGLGLVIWLNRLRLDRGPRRRLIDRIAQTCLGVSAALAFVLIALPYSVDWSVDAAENLTTPDQLAIAGVWGVVVTSLWQIAKRRIAAAAKYLGGVLLALALVVFALRVMAAAGDSDALFGNWLWPLGTVALLTAAMITLNPDSWSLHSLYRTRLAGTFVTQRTKKGVEPLLDEPMLAEFAGADGPMPVICCAVARTTRSFTGIPALSMTLDPHEMAVHRWPDNEHAERPVKETLSLDRFVARLPNRQAAHIATPMGAAAVSGAAVAPSLGRMSLRSTNALLAAFNARLGMWLPNPRTDHVSKTTPRVVNMFKEMLGLYDSDDPNVYATDGGHWENLGLVELVRRRCEVIICLDASGDEPGTYKTLKEAIKLAGLECGAKIDVPDETWEALAVGDDGICQRNYGLASVEYRNGDKGTILYIKAAVMAHTSLPIHRYASADVTFPRYSTGDQFLTEEELTNLLKLGYESTEMALKEHHDKITAVALGLSSPPGPQASAPPASEATSDQAGQAEGGNPHAGAGAPATPLPLPISAPAAGVDAPTSPAVFGHRGGNKGQQNSVEAILASMDAGAEGVEIDVRLTPDGELIARHDLEASRTESTTQLAEILQVTSRAGMALLLDVKTVDDPKREATAIAGILDEDRDAATVVVSSFDLDFLGELRERVSWVDLVPIISLRQNFWRRVSPDEWSGVSVLAAALLVKPFLGLEAKRAGKRFYVWFGATEWPFLIRQSAKLGADGLILSDVAKGRAIIDPK